MKYEVEGARPRVRPKKTWREIVERGHSKHMSHPKGREGVR